MASRRLIIAMSTAIAVTTATGVAYAAGNSSHPKPSPTGSPGAHPLFGGPGMFGHRPPGALPNGAGGPGAFGGGGFGGGPGGLLGRIEHGQAVVSKPGGGTVTEALQNGTATAVSSTSITVKSDDGYTHSYVINSSTHQLTGCSAPKLATGDGVTVIATVKGSTETAQAIVKRGAFAPSAAGSTPSPRPMPTGTSAPGPGGSCGAGPGFGGGPRGFGDGSFGPPRPMPSSSTTS